MSAAEPPTTTPEEWEGLGKAVPPLYPLVNHPVFQAMPRQAQDQFVQQAMEIDKRNWEIIARPSVGLEMELAKRQEQESDFAKVVKSQDFWEMSAPARDSYMMTVEPLYAEMSEKKRGDYLSELEKDYGWVGKLWQEDIILKDPDAKQFFETLHDFLGREGTEPGDLQSNPGGKIIDAMMFRQPEWAESMRNIRNAWEKGDVGDLAKTSLLEMTTLGWQTATAPTRYAKGVWGRAGDIGMSFGVGVAYDSPASFLELVAGACEVLKYAPPWFDEDYVRQMEATPGNAEAIMVAQQLGVHAGLLAGISGKEKEEILEGFRVEALALAQGFRQSGDMWMPGDHPALKTGRGLGGAPAEIAEIMATAGVFKIGAAALPVIAAIKEMGRTQDPMLALKEAAWTVPLVFGIRWSQRAPNMMERMARGGHTFGGLAMTRSVLTGKPLTIEELATEYGVGAGLTVHGRAPREKSYRVSEAEVRAVMESSPDMGRVAPWDPIGAATQRLREAEGYRATGERMPTERPGPGGVIGGTQMREGLPERAGEREVPWQPLVKEGAPNREQWVWERNSEFRESYIAKHGKPPSELEGFKNRVERGKEWDKEWIMPEPTPKEPTPEDFGPRPEEVEQRPGGTEQPAGEGLGPVQRDELVGRDAEVNVGTYKKKRRVKGKITEAEEIDGEWRVTVEVPYAGRRKGTYRRWFKLDDIEVEEGVPRGKPEPVEAKPPEPQQEPLKPEEPREPEFWEQDIEADNPEPPNFKGEQQGELTGDVAWGKDTMLFLADGQKVRVRYAVMEEADLIASHDPTKGFEPDPNYPEFGQYKDYRRQESLSDRVRLFSEDWEPSLLWNNSPTITNGPSVITRDRVVRGGNARYMVQRLVDPDARIKVAKENAEQFGIDAKELDRFERPVPVRVMLERHPMSRNEELALSQRLDQKESGDADAMGKGAAGAAMLSEKSVDLIDGIFEQAGHDATVRDIAGTSKEIASRLIEDGVILKGEIDSYTKDGRLNRNGMNLFEEVLLGRLIQDTNTARSMYPKLQDRVLRLAPTVIRGESMLPGSIREKFEGAVLSEIRRNGMKESVEDFIHEADMLNPTPSQLDVQTAQIHRWLAPIDSGGAKPLEATKTARGWSRRLGDAIGKQTSLEPMTVEKAWAETWAMKPSEMRAAGPPGEALGRKGVAQLRQGQQVLTELGPAEVTSIIRPRKGKGANVVVRVNAGPNAGRKYRVKDPRKLKPIGEMPTEIAVEALREREAERRGEEPDILEGEDTLAAKKGTGGPPTGKGIPGIPPQPPPSGKKGAFPKAKYKGTVETVWDPSIPRKQLSVADRILRKMRWKNLESVKIRQDIMADLARSLGMPVQEGRIKGPKGLLGYYVFRVNPKSSAGEIRIRDHGDIETTAHEIAHLIDYATLNDPNGPRAMFTNDKQRIEEIRELIQLSYTADPRLVLTEGWAEFVRHWMTDPHYVYENAPNMVRWVDKWTETDPRGPALLKAREEMTKWLQSHPMDRVRSKQGYHEEVGIYEGTIWNRHRQSMWDDLEGFSQMERDLTGSWYPDGGVYQTARLTRGKAGLIMGAMRYGAPEYAMRGEGPPPKGPGGIELPDSYVRFNGPGFDQFMGRVNNRMEEWLAYAIAKRAQKLSKQDRENLFSEDEIAFGLSLENKEFKEVFDQWNEFNRKVLKFAVDSGVLKASDMEKFDLDTYLPFYRVGQSAPKAAAGTPPGKVRGWYFLSGGSENLRPVLQNMLQNTAMWIDLSVTNQARGKAIQLAMNSPRGARWLTRERPDRIKTMVRIDPSEMEKRFWNAYQMHPSQVDPVVRDFIKDGFKRMGPNHQAWLMNQTPRTQNVVAWMNKGVPDYYKATDNVLFRSFLALQRPKEQNPVVNAMDLGRRFGQATVTLTPEFVLANFMRDTFMASVFSRYGMVPFKNSFEGLGRRLFHDETYKLWMANGGAFAGLQMREKAYRRHLDRMYSERGVNPRSVIMGAQDILRFAQSIADSAEAASRVGEMHLGIKKGEDPRTAAYWSREVATDFAMRGDSRLLAGVQDSAMFLRAGMNGLDRVYRGFVRDPHRGSVWVKSMMTVGSAMGLYLYNRGNPLYDELDDADKDANFHFIFPNAYYFQNRKNMPSNDELIQIYREDKHPQRRLLARKELERRYHHFRMPSWWEIGAMAKSGERFMESFLDAWEGEETIPGALKNAGSDALRLTRSQFRLMPLPYWLTPALEVGFNKDFYTWRPIEGASAETRGVRFLQSNTWTNPYLAKLFKDASEMVPRDSQYISPAQTEALIRGYLNTMGAWMLIAMEQQGEGAPDVPWSRTFVARRFVGDKAVFRNDAANDLFEVMGVANDYFASHRTMLREGDRAAATRWALRPETLKVQKVENRYAELRGQRDLMLKSPHLSEVQEHAKELNREKFISDKEMKALRDDGTLQDIGALKLHLGAEYKRIMSDFSRTGKKEIETVIEKRRRTAR